MLTDEQIVDLRKSTGPAKGYTHWADTIGFARAIESAATEPLLQRITELEEMNAQLREQNTEVGKVCAELERRIEVGKNIVRNDIHRIGQLQAQATKLERQLEEAQKQISKLEEAHENTVYLYSITK